MMNDGEYSGVTCKCGDSMSLMQHKAFGECADCYYGNVPQERHYETHQRASRALDVQEGGDHYRTKGIQPIEYIFANEIGFAEGNVIKYVSRWKDKGGIEDLKKARHYLDLLIEAQE